MQIANPMYDVVFKRLMENKQVARFIIGTILDLEVLSLEVKSREFTYQGEDSKIHLFRLDFIAVIKTPEGSKKVLIEVQKSRRLLKADTHRFRTYLGQQYSSKAKIEEESEGLSIITIYILGFNLGGIETPYLRVRRQYEDGLTGNLIQKRHKFIESLSHDSYYIQAPRIKGKWSTRLERLLSIFEQRYFINEKTLKDYPYPVEDDSDMAVVIETLYRAGSDSEVREKLDLEAEVWERTEEILEESIKNKKMLAEQNEALAKQTEALAKQNETLAQKDKALTQQTEALTQAQQKASEQERIIAELRKQLANDNK